MDAPPLQPSFDRFVKAFGGELVSDLITGSNPPENADYLFRKQGFIAELKALENETFGESYKRRLGELIVSWTERRLLLIYGKDVPLSLRGIPPECQQEWIELLAKRIQRVFAKASSQIGATKSLLGLPDAKGVILLASDGNVDLQPADVWSLLLRINAKKHPDGSFQYSNIDGMTYFNPRMPVSVPALPERAIFWICGFRKPGDESVADFLGQVGTAWHDFLARETGQVVKRYRSGSESLLENSTFSGGPRMPKIDVPWPEPD